MDHRKLFKYLENIIFGMIIFVLIIATGFVVKSRLENNDVPTIAGYKMLVVLSGSMSPEFEPGAVVFIKKTKPAELKQGDIITYRKIDDFKTFVTHRILKSAKISDGLAFKTKGDANKAADPELVPSGNVEGKVMLSVPYIGYLLEFIKTPRGLLFVIVVPGFLIIINELRKIIVAIKELEVKSDNGVK